MTTPDTDPRELLDLALERAGASEDAGARKLPDGKTLTLYVGTSSSPLSVAKITEVRLTKGVLEAKTGKGEHYLVALSDLLAVMVSGGSEPGAQRKAGFLG